MCDCDKRLILQLRIHLLCDLPVHVDGEPWNQSAGQIVVLRSALKVRSYAAAHIP